MKKQLFLFVLFLHLTILSGCSILAPYEQPLTQGTVIDQEALDTLQEGLSKDQVRTLLGPPLGENLYNPLHWEYVFYTTDKELHPEAAEHVIIRFDNDAYVKDWAVEKKLVQLDDRNWLERLFNL